MCQYTDTLIFRYLKRPKLGLGYVIPEKMSIRTFWHDMKDLYVLHPDERDIAVIKLY